MKGGGVYTSDEGRLGELEYKKEVEPKSFSSLSARVSER